MEKKLEDYDFTEMSEKDAAEIGPFGPDDRPCAVTCYRTRTKFRSRKAARRFFETGALCCCGSEQERYSEIVRQLDSGLDEVSDGCL